MTPIEQANKVITEYESMVILCSYNILFTNDIVVSRIIEAMDDLRKSPLCRHLTKRWMNRVLDMQRDYEKKLNEVIGDRSAFFADANDLFVEDVNKHVEILFWTIKREFDRYKFDHSYVLAKLELARTLCQLGCLQFDRRIEEMQSMDNRFRMFRMDYLRQTDLLHGLNELMRTFIVPCTVNLDTDECNQAISVLSLKLADGQTIAKAISA